jgi:hypothetical protein
VIFSSYVRLRRKSTLDYEPGVKLYGKIIVLNWRGDGSYYLLYSLMRDLASCSPIKVESKTVKAIGSLFKTPNEGREGDSWIVIELSKNSIRLFGAKLIRFRISFSVIFS